MAMACGGKSGDSGSDGGTSGTGAPYINILSPSSGQFIDEGDEVLLEAEGRLGDGRPSELSGLTWSSDDGVFAVEGNGLLVVDLHPGVYALELEGTVAGLMVADRVEVAVYAQ
jgi:hypothetical protein